MLEKEIKIKNAEILAGDAESIVELLGIALSAIPEGLAIYDRDDRLVLRNDNFLKDREQYEKIVELGRTFEEILNRLNENKDGLGFLSKEKISIADRLENHRNPKGPREVVTSNVNLVQIEEVKIIDGYTIVTRTDKTELRQAERDLSESESRLWAFLNNSPSAVLVKDVEGRYIQANQVWHNWFNPDGKDIKGLTVYDFFPEDHARHIAKSDQEVINTKKVIDTETATPLADGRVLNTHLQKFPVIGDDGTLLGIGGINTDISDRVAARQILQKSHAETETKYRALFESANDGIVIRDTKSREIIDVNHVFASRLGYSETELKGQKLEKFSPVRASEQERAQRLASMSDNASVHLERIHRRKDGSEFPVEISSSRLKIEGRDVILSLVRDITERKEIEKAIVKSEARFKDFAESSADRFWETDEDHKFIYVSELPSDSPRLTPSDLIGKARWELDGIDANSDEWQKYLADIEAHKPIKNFQYRRVLPNGEDVWIKVGAKPVFGEDGEFKGYRGTNLDITELVSRRVEAEKANAAKSDFLSSMSHELRTPLNAILGFAQLLENRRNKLSVEKSLNYTREILRGGEHLLELIDQVLELSKIEAGKTNLSIEDVSLKGVVEEAFKMVSSRAEASNVTLHDEISEQDIPLLQTDRGRLRQILLNLLSNAIKYNRSGGTVVVSVENRHKGMLRIFIKDTGFGIPANFADQLFEPFNRLGKESGEIEGTGIGLTITKQIIELLGGQIGFESEANEGSLFWVDVPVSVNSLEVAENSISPIEQSVHKQMRNGSAKILYVEDNPSNLTLMSEVIAQLDDIEMEAAESAEIAFDQITKSRPNLIIMDINLPGLDGIEAIKKLKQDEDTKSIPIIALSAAAMPNQVKRGKDAGFLEYITKPIKVEEIQNAIKKHLR